MRLGILRDDGNPPATGADGWQRQNEVKLMKCFRLIETVLDEQYQLIPGKSESAKDAAITKRLEDLSKQYRNLAQSVTIDYSDPITRFAYICRYVTAHANIVSDVLTYSDSLKTLFDQDSVHISCLGGGPGSDFLGVLKFLELYDKKPKLKCILYDKEQAWGECWMDVEEKLSTKLQMTTFLQAFDVTDRKVWSAHTKFLNADLFTMVYFMSELHALRPAPDAFFDYCMQQCKTGAYFLYVDNKSPEFRGWFDTLSARHKLKVVKSASESFQLGSDEQKTDLKKYFLKFGCPKLTAKIDYRVCQKL